MAPFSTALRRLGALAALAGLLAQSFLPAAHAWVVDTREAAYHTSVHDAAPKASLCDDHDRGHRHHTDADCPLCPLYSSARLAAAHGSRDARVPASPRNVPLRAVAAASSVLGSGNPVRAPPAVLSA